MSENIQISYFWFLKYHNKTFFKIEKASQD